MKQPRPLTEIQRDIDAMKERISGAKQPDNKRRLAARQEYLIKERQDAELWIRTQLS